MNVEKECSMIKNQVLQDVRVFFQEDDHFENFLLIVLKITSKMAVLIIQSIIFLMICLIVNMIMIKIIILTRILLIVLRSTIVDCDNYGDVL